MNTRDSIKQTGLKLFNKKGLMNVTLREVAASMKKSYGNITYHFKTKEELIRELYTDMIGELQEISVMKDPFELTLIFQLPIYTFDISLRYLFFYVDYMELKRNYPEFMKEVDKNNLKRSKVFLHLLIQLRDNGMIQSNVDDETLLYIMELSGAIRTFYFQRHYNHKAVKEEYVEYVNKLLLPYLTVKGRKIYHQSN